MVKGIEIVEMQSESLIFSVAIFLLTFANDSFWIRLHAGLGPVAQSLGAYIGATILLLALLCLLLGLMTPGWTIKPVLMLILIVAAGASYFMDHYGAIIDRHALQSALETDARESAEWLSKGMIMPFIKIALAPILVIVFLIKLKPRTLLQGLKRRTLLLVCSAILCGASVGINYQTFASLARNHTPLRDLFNPVNVINAARAYVKKNGSSLPSVVAPTAQDVSRGESWSRRKLKPTVFVLVIGESVRASSFGLISNDGQRDTTPRLRQLPLIYFEQVDSCGTNTATSVPCIFSNLTRQHYDDQQALSRENLLDVLMRAGFAVEWIDNNTGSKYVARRATETDVAHRTDPRYCNSDGCHDGMLINELEQRLKKLSKDPRDSVIVLHQLGSHGPAYYQRYPKDFARFLPACESVELQNCTQEEVRNSYENSVLYTDFVLAEVIRVMQAAKGFESVLFYVSDHGESTGENGFYLHGAPYAFAPIEQTRVPMFWWFSSAFETRRKLDVACMRHAREEPTSHDAIFPMTLYILDLHSDDYNPRLNPLADCG